VREYVPLLSGVYYIRDRGCCQALVQENYQPLRTFEVGASTVKSSSMILFSNRRVASFRLRENTERASPFPFTTPNRLALQYGENALTRCTMLETPRVVNERMISLFFIVILDTMGGFCAREKQEIERGFFMDAIL